MVTSGKSDRLNLRIEPEVRELLESAAVAANVTLTSFILSAAKVRAEQQLADKVSFTANADQWDTFMTALDRPARAIPRLQRLLADSAPAVRPTQLHED